VLPWRGTDKPTVKDIAGLDFLEHGLTDINIFGLGGAEVVANAPLAGGVLSNLHDVSIGVTHKVWGWHTAMTRARIASDRLA
jgi:hypothetical protein